MANKRLLEGVDIFANALVPTDRANVEGWRY